tara:strand:- start:70 stop:267 length:198 start_codon:yes stop_codon:yes gene_type:complete
LVEEELEEEVHLLEHFTTVVRVERKDQDPTREDMVLDQVVWGVKAVMTMLAVAEVVGGSVVVVEG